MYRLETSLHVQRKPYTRLYPCYHGRNISACAEKTSTLVFKASLIKKHLCMCRENHDIQLRRYATLETSLHVQRKPLQEPLWVLVLGNISACAEKTDSLLGGRCHLGKHLCMCRENPHTARPLCNPPETSLHVQRKLSLWINPRIYSGNISACAEKTTMRTHSHAACRKHLCMCRENDERENKEKKDGETSLHVQRKHARYWCKCVCLGNISACAEKTVCGCFL